MGKKTAFWLQQPLWVENPRLVISKGFECNYPNKISYELVHRIRAETSFLGQNGIDHPEQHTCSNTHPLTWQNTPSGVIAGYSQNNPATSRRYAMAWGDHPVCATAETRGRRSDCTDA